MTSETSQPGTSQMNKCISCLRPERVTGPQLEIGPNGDLTICDNCKEVR